MSYDALLENTNVVCYSSSGYGNTWKGILTMNLENEYLNNFNNFSCAKNNFNFNNSLKRASNCHK